MFLLGGMFWVVFKCAGIGAAAVGATVCGVFGVSGGLIVRDHFADQNFHMTLSTGPR